MRLDFYYTTGSSRTTYVISLPSSLTSIDVSVIGPGGDGDIHDGSFGGFGGGGGGCIEGTVGLDGGDAFGTAVITVGRGGHLSCSSLTLEVNGSSLGFDYLVAGGGHDGSTDGHGGDAWTCHHSTNLVSVCPTDPGGCAAVSGTVATDGGDGVAGNALVGGDGGNACGGSTANGGSGSTPGQDGDDVDFGVGGGGGGSAPEYSAAGTGADGFVSIGWSDAGTLLTLTFTVTAPTISSPSTRLEPARITRTLQAVSPDLYSGTSIDVATVAATFSLFDVVRTGGGNTTVPIEDTADATASISSLSLTRTLTPDAVDITTSITAPDFSYTGFIFYPDAVIGTFSAIAPAVVGGSLDLPVDDGVTITFDIRDLFVLQLTPDSPRGREQISVDQPQGGENYPFIQPSEDLGELIGDLYLNYVDAACAYESPFRVKWLYGFGDDVVSVPVTPTHTYDMEIVDKNDQVVFDSTAADQFKMVDWGNDIDGYFQRIIEWTNTTTGEILRAVVFTSWDPDRTSRTWDIYFEPTDGRIDSRTLEAIPRHVHSLAVITDPYLPDDFTEIGNAQNVLITGGYNAALSINSTDEAEVNVDGKSFTRIVQLDLEAGLGLGRFPCTPEIFIKHINGIAPDERGNITLTTADLDNKGSCYRVERPFTITGAHEAEITPASLQLSNDCGPCCECQDFINVYEAIRKLTNHYRDSGLRAEAVRDQFRTNRERWLTSAACRDENRMQSAAEAAAPCKVAIAVGLCNGSASPLTDVEVRICFDYGPDEFELQARTDQPGCVVCNTTTRKGNTLAGSFTGGRAKPYTLSGTYPSFSGYFDCINPGTTGVLSFVMEFPGCTPGQVVEFVARAFGEDTASATPTRQHITLIDNIVTDCCVTGGSSELSISSEISSLCAR